MPDVSLHPRDAHNNTLLENVHPSGWINPTPTGRYNLVVIGAGTAGLVTAAVAAALGAKVALVERHLMGGDCLNTGCVPSKALLAAAKAGPQDFGAVMERVRRLRSEISPHDSAARFRDLGVDVYFGEANFRGTNVLEVDGAKLSFKKAVIATGARPTIPDISGLEASGCLTSDTLWSLTTRPGHLVILGGGPIGCEMAQAFRCVGSAVTLVERGASLLPRDDPAAGAMLHDVLTREGVQVLLNAAVLSVEHKQVRVMHGGTETVIAADEILAATGRTPNVEALDLATAGVEHDGHGIKVNDFLQTTNAAIYACGDVCLPYRFTHAADFAARTVAQNALLPLLPRKRFSRHVIPWCTYTDPEVAHTGATPDELHARGEDFETVHIPLSEVDRAHLDGQTDGFLNLHVGRKGRLLGGTLVGPHAGDMISELTLAIASGLKIGALGAAIHPYPTYGEIFRMASDHHNRKRLTPTLKAVLGWVMARSR